MAMIDNHSEMVVWLKKQKLGGAHVVALLQGGSMAQEWSLNAGIDATCDAIYQHMLGCLSPEIIGENYKLASYKGSSSGAAGSFDLIVSDEEVAAYDWQLWRSKQSKLVRLTFEDDVGEVYDFDLQTSDLVTLRDRLNEALKEIGS